MQARLVFFTGFDYPSTHAHPIHGLAMARAFASALGADFLFVVSSVRDKRELTGINYVALHQVWARALGLRTFYSFFAFPVLALSKRLTSGDTVFVNDVNLAIVAILWRTMFGYHVTFESHGEYLPRRQAFVLKRADRVVFVTHALQERAIARSAALASKSTVIPNAVDIDAFDAVHASSAELRRELELPQEPFVVGYIGRFSPMGIDKGVSFMLKAAKFSDPYTFLFVGGNEREIADVRSLARQLDIEDRVRCIPFVRGELIPKYAKACDALAYVPSDVSSHFHQVETSPMKLFEYMAARRPIVVSDTPSVREVLDEQSAFFIAPNDAKGFIAAIRTIQTDPDEAKRRSAVAFARVKENSWERRAARILALSR